MGTNERLCSTYMILALDKGTVQVLGIVIPVVGTIIVAVVAGVFSHTSNKTVKKAGEIYEAFDERGQVITALRERIDVLEEAMTESRANERQCIERLDVATRRL